LAGVTDGDHGVSGYRAFKHVDPRRESIAPPGRRTAPSLAEEAPVADVADLDDLAALYRDLHAHPELAFAERRTASIAAERLHGLGYQVTAAVGGTGVVGMLENGDGPTVLLRADMDALPVLEQTGLPYASTRRVRDTAGNDVPVMHACGHDMHVSCLLGAAAELAAQAASGAWHGRLLLVFQPAEEGDGGAQAMINDGLYNRFPLPDIVLGQHVMPLPAGVLGLHGGPAMAAADAIRIVLHGEGGHGSRPETTVDPVLMAAATVLRLQGIVSREVAAADTAVLTVGALHAGTAANIIPDRAEMELSLRSFDEKVHDKVRNAIDRIVRAEAAASGARRDPEITTTSAFPLLVNDPAASARLTEVFNGSVGLTLDPGPVTGSEDVGVLATAAGVPCAYWFIGGSDPTLFAGVTTIEEARGIVDGLPSNHSPFFAPVIEPTLRTGITALTTAARTYLAPAG
jgi:hippurate hydrolase